MTQKEFVEVKELVEKATGFKFDDDEASIYDDGCYFNRWAGLDTISLNIYNNRSSDVRLIRHDDYDLKIYAANFIDIKRCLDVFAHVGRC